MKINNQKDPIGSLRISQNVIATIARTTAREIDGVAALTHLPADFKQILSKRQMPKPVSVTLADDIASIDMYLLLKEGAKIPLVCERVQQAVKESVQSMTGITVSKVNVMVSGITFDKSSVSEA